VTVEVTEEQITVKGPKGTLVRAAHPLVTVSVTDGVISVDVQNKEERQERSLWGTYSSHLANMVEGVQNGFKKQLEINGVGYKVAMQGTDLKIEVGFSHSVIYNIPETVLATVEKNVITLESPDKELLGKTAAEIRSIRPPEPYKGKGIKYVGEELRRKAGKSAAK
ncbi:MAG: 50S ribosomal protein L6, partial [Crocinitomicaceae bacterium]